MKPKMKNIKQNLMHVLSGSILTEDFFVKNWRFLLVVFVITALYISNRFSCISRISEIESLKKELKEAKYRSLAVSSELIGIGRLSQVEALVNKNGLELTTSKEPTAKIEK